MKDPHLQYCSGCHRTWKPKLYHKLVMIITGGYVWRCSQCGTVMRYVLIHHVVKMDSQRVKGKEKLWRKP